MQRVLRHGHNITAAALFTLAVWPSAMAMSSTFLATFTEAVKRHRVEGGERLFVVHVVGAANDVEGKTIWSDAERATCDGTTVVLVGPQLSPSSNSTRGADGPCAVRRVRGMWTPAVLEGARFLSERERRPDLLILFNADLYGCPWRRTLFPSFRSLSWRAHREAFEYVRAALQLLYTVQTFR